MLKLVEEDHKRVSSGTTPEGISDIIFKDTRRYGYEELTEGSHAKEES